MSRQSPSKSQSYLITGVTLVAATLLGYGALQLRSDRIALERAAKETEERTSRIEMALQPELTVACQENVGFWLRFAAKEVIDKADVDLMNRILQATTPAASKLRGVLYESAGLPFDGTVRLTEMDVGDCYAVRDKLYASEDTRELYARTLSDILKNK